MKNHCICEKCGHNHIVDKREIALFRGMVLSLAHVYKWLKENKRHEFQRKEINHLLTDGNKSARFGDWVYFGGLAYKGEKKGDWGLNMDRCEKFFCGHSMIPTRVLKDPITKKIEKFDYKHESDIPGLHRFLDENGLYDAKYVSRDLFKDVKEDDDVIII